MVYLTESFFYVHKLRINIQNIQSNNNFHIGNYLSFSFFNNNYLYRASKKIKLLLGLNVIGSWVSLCKREDLTIDLRCPGRQFQNLNRKGNIYT